MMDSRGGNLRRLTDTDFEDEYPKWSPDGALIAFESLRGGFSQIYVMRADGSDVQQVAVNDYDEIGLTWSPTGK